MEREPVHRRLSLNLNQHNQLHIAVATYVLYLLQTRRTTFPGRPYAATPIRRYPLRSPSLAPSPLPAEFHISYTLTILFPPHAPLCNTSKNQFRRNIRICRYRAYSNPHLPFPHSGQAPMLFLRS